VVSITWDDFNGSVYSNEVSRAWLASVITAMDLMIVMQDWEFPTFTNPFDIKLPGRFNHARFWQSLLASPLLSIMPCLATKPSLFIQSRSFLAIITCLVFATKHSLFIFPFLSFLDRHGFVDD
jgi:hypothetical protein